MGTLKRLNTALPGLCLLLALSINPAHGGSLEDGSRAFVQSLADQAIQSLTAPGTNRQARIDRFRDLFNEHFAVRGIGKWILGRHWRKASEAERREYLELFEDLIVTSYVNRFAEYTGEPLKIIKTLVHDENTAIVFTEILQSKAQTPVRVTWRVARGDGGFKVTDVVVEGTSMSNTMRSDFGSIIRRKGGKVSGLLEVLRQKTEALKKE